MEKEKQVNNKWYFYVCCFFVYCIIGWIYEVIWEFAIGNGFVNRGFLHGCYLPIYGFGALILIFSLRKLMNKEIRVFKSCLIDNSLLKKIKLNPNMYQGINESIEQFQMLEEEMSRKFTKGKRV